MPTPQDRMCEKKVRLTSVLFGNRTWVMCKCSPPRERHCCQQNIIPIIVANPNFFYPIKRPLFFYYLNKNCENLKEKTKQTFRQKTKLIFKFNLYRFIMQMIRDPYNTDSNPSHFDRRIGLTDL